MICLKVGNNRDTFYIPPHFLLPSPKAVSEHQHRPSKLIHDWPKQSHGSPFGHLWIEVLGLTCWPSLSSLPQFWASLLKDLLVVIWNTPCWLPLLYLMSASPLVLYTGSDHRTLPNICILSGYLPHPLSHPWRCILTLGFYLSQAAPTWMQKNKTLQYLI